VELCFGEGLIHILDKVGDVFDAHGEPDQAVGDAAGFSDFLGNRGMGHNGRMVDQRLHAAQRLREREHFDRFAEANGRGPLVFENDSDDTAASTHLFLGQCVVGVTFLEWVYDIFQLSVTLEMLGQCQFLVLNPSHIG